MIKSKENRELLEKVLALTKLKRSACKRFLGSHKSSLDHYMYRSDGYIYKFGSKKNEIKPLDEFPENFSFHFLNAIYASLLNKNLSRKKNEEDQVKEKYSGLLLKDIILTRDEIAHIDTVFAKGDTITLFEIDELINKYRGSFYLQEKLKNDPAMKKLFDGGLDMDASFEEVRIKKSKNKVKNIHQKTNFEFENILKQCESLKINEKLLMPALIFHISNLVKLSSDKYIKLNNVDFVECYINLVAPKEKEYVEFRGDIENFDKGEKDFDLLSSKEFDQNSELINSIRNFFPVLENFRKIKVPKYFSPREYNVYSSENKTLLPKQFINQINELNAEKEKVEKFLNDAQKLTKQLKELDEIPNFLKDSEKKIA